MTSVAALWVASLVGAVLFFLAGFLAAKSRSSAPAGAGDGAGTGRTTAAADAPDSTAQAEKLAGLVAERDALEGEVAELKRELEGQVTELEAELERRVSELESELEKQATEFEEELSKARDEAGAGPDEPAAAAATDADADADADADETAEPGDSATRNFILEMQDEVSTTDIVMDSLQRRLDDDDAMRAITLGDDLGMPIVGVGGHNESLAAFSSLIEYMSMRTRSLLPIGELRRVTVEDQRGVIVSACVLTGKNLTLITMSRETGPTTSDLVDFLESVSQIL